MKSKLLIFLLIAATCVSFSQYKKSSGGTGALTDSAGFYTTLPHGTPLAAWLITNLPWPGNDTTQHANMNHSGMLWYQDWNIFNNKLGVTDTGVYQADATHSGFLSYVDWNKFNTPQLDTNSVADATHSGFLWYQDWAYFNSKPDTSIGPFAAATQSGFMSYSDYVRLSKISDPTNNGSTQISADAGSWIITPNGILYASSGNNQIGTVASPIDTIQANTIIQDGNKVVDIVNGPFSYHAAKWTQMNEGLNDVTIRAVGYSQYGNVYAGTNIGGMAVTPIRSSWSMINTGLTNASVRSIFTLGDSVYIGTTNGGLFTAKSLNFVQWTSSNTGLPSQTITAMISDGTSLFAGATGAGIYKSTDGGLTWASSGLPGGTPRALAVKGTTIYAGMGSSNVGMNMNPNIDVRNARGADMETEVEPDPVGFIGVQVSTDGGATWVAHNNNLSTTEVHSLAVTSTGTILAGTSYGIFYSTDDAATWNFSQSITSTDISALVVGASSGKLFAGSVSPGDVYVSLDDGITWQTTELTMGGSVYCLTIAGNSLYAGTSNGVYTFDWASWNPPVNGLLQASDFYKFNTKADTTNGPFADASHSGLISGSDYKTWMDAILVGWSTNGSNWLVPDYSYQSIGQSDIPVDTVFATVLIQNGHTIPDTTIGPFATTTQSGLLSYIDFARFDAGGSGGDTNVVATATNTGFLWYQDWDYFNSKPDTLIGPFASATTSGFLNYSDWYRFNSFVMPAGLVDTTNGPIVGKTTTWGPWVTGSGVQAFTSIGNKIFAGGYGYGIMKSTDNGSTWTDAKGGVSALNLTLSLTSTGTDIYAGYNDGGSGGGIYTSTNYGENWTNISTGLPNASVNAIILSSSNLFVAVNGADKVYLSTDNGSSWTGVPPGGPANVQSFAITTSSSLLAATNGDYIYKTTNNGTSWTHLTTGLGAYSNIFALAVSGSNIYAGSYGGLYLSTDDGDTWTKTGIGLEAESYIMAINISGSTMYCAGNIGIIYSSIDAGITWTDVGNLSSSAVSTLYPYNSYIFAGTNDGVRRSKEDLANQQPGYAQVGLLTYADWKKFTSNIAIKTKAAIDDSITNGNNSTYLGYKTGNHSVGGYNTSFGYEADFSIHNSVTGSTIFGAKANYSDTTGNNCSFFGYLAGYHNVAGYSTGFGSEVLYWNTTGYHNTAIGYMTLYMNTDGYDNTAIGHYSMWNHFTGWGNTAVGAEALYSQQGANKNTAIGRGALYAVTYASNNTALGYSSLSADTAGEQNTAVGSSALVDITDGWGNVGIGLAAGNSTTATANKNLLHSTFIGRNSTSTKQDVENSTALGNEATVTADNQMVFGNASVTSNLFHGSMSIDGKPLALASFDKSIITLSEEFFTGGMISDHYFQLGWRGNNGSPAVAYENGRYGLCKINSASADMELTLSPTTFGLWFLPANFTMTTNFKVKSTPDDANRVAWGLAYPFSRGYPNNGVYIRCDSTTAHWICVSADGGNVSTVYTTVAVDADYHDFTISRAGTALSYYIDGTLVGTISDNIPTSYDNMEPIYVVNKDSGSVTVEIYIDYWTITVTGINRGNVH